jgi:site-specific recombinase XerD
MIQIPSDSKTGAREAIATADASIYFKRLNEFSQHNQPDDYVICDYHGKSVYNWGKTLSKILTDLDMLYTPEGRKRTRYSFRHYYITHRLEDGVPVHLVAYVTGTSISNITKHYFHVTKEERLKAATLEYLENTVNDRL